MNAKTVMHEWGCGCPQCELERNIAEGDSDILHAANRNAKQRCTWGCECERCKAVRARWHDAVTLPDDVLLLPANSFAAARMEQSRSPYSMERRSMHRECVSAEDELQGLIKVAERENKGSDVIVSVSRNEFRPGIPWEVNRLEISIQQSDNLLKETNETD